MPRPTARDVHRDAILTNVSIAYRNSSYIADMVFPVIPVANQSDFYYVFDKGAWFRDRVAVRAPGTRAKRADYAITSASYFCMPYALSKAVPDEVRDNADTPLRPEIEAAEFVTDGLLLGQEIRVADLLTASGNWASASNPSVLWSNDTSDPIRDMDTAVNAVVSKIGRFPNVAVMSWDVWRRIKRHPDFIDRVKYTRPGGTPQPTDLQEFIGVEKVLIGLALKDTSEEGATSSVSYIWGNMFWTGYVTPTAAINSPTAGYAFQWGGRQVDRFREDQEKQDVFSAEHKMDEVITASDAGAIFSTVA